MLCSAGELPQREALAAGLAPRTSGAAGAAGAGPKPLSGLAALLSSAYAAGGVGAVALANADELNDAGAAPASRGSGSDASAPGEAPAVTLCQWALVSASPAPVEAVALTESRLRLLHSVLADPTLPPTAPSYAAARAAAGGHAAGVWRRGGGGRH